MTGRTGKVFWVLSGITIGLVIAAVLFLVMGESPLSQWIKTGQASTVPVEPIPVDQSEPPVNTEYLKLRDEANQQLDVIRKINVLKQKISDLSTLLTQMDAHAQTADELKEVIAIREEIQRLSTEADQKRRQYIENELAQLENEFSDLKKNPIEKADSLLIPLDQKIERCTTLLTVPTEDLKSQRQAMLDELRLFKKKLNDQKPLFTELIRLDSAYADREKMTKILQQVATKYPQSEYGKAFPKVLHGAATLDALKKWNLFIEQHGKNIDAFAVEPKTAATTISFFHENGKSLDFLEEWPVLAKRIQAWKNSVRNVPVAKKISDLLRHAGSRPLWLYKKTPFQWYYLTAAPVPGANDFLTDLFGNVKQITIPNQDVVAIAPDPSVAFFADLAKLAENTDDAKRYSDPGRWYAQWSELVEKIRTNNEIDPLVRFLYLKDICSTLSLADYHFQIRFSAWMRVLETKSLAGNVDWFDADREETGHLRQNAKQLLAFLEKDKLGVEKTTAELNKSVKKIAHLYRAVGWLDRDFAGTWYCRGTASEKLPDGLLMSPLVTPNEPTHWIQLGKVENGKPIVEIASTELIRGMIVLLRTSF